MRLINRTLVVTTSGRGLFEFTDAARRFVAESGIREGLLVLFCRHTSASLLIQENADPEVREDLESFFGRLVPEGRSQWRHATEGPDDMPAHIRSALTQSSLTIPVVDRVLALGTWQGLYLWEHRTRPHRREIVFSLLGV
ncbi:MAG: secondary thiamine-phosphate synthase enzyme YjbQ [Hydrogenophilus sp.]|nr:secondary thiamine-phosphate synthase enzyme YjbQ [Hydrogenophilus sp.]